MYQDSVKIKEMPEDECEVPIVDTATFDINVYLGFFDKLKLDSGKESHMIGGYNSRSGSPLLYVTDTSFNEPKYIKKTIGQARSYMDSIIEQRLLHYKNDSLSEDEIFRRIAIYENQKGCFDRKYALIRFAADSTNRLYNNLFPDDTEEGYLQYLFFNQMGEQFALYWHSFYGEKTVICNRKDIEYFLDYYNDRKDSFSFEKNKIRDLLDSDLSPTVSLDSVNCTITWYEIFTHRGIFKKTYKIERDYPFQIMEVTEEEVAEISATFFF
ncbi:MAG: hypothetical protein JW976_06475 [Syntrophaceae bacterium]|nr:hypothetical protein [Syntrophaceae bacterium]